VPQPHFTVTITASAVAWYAAIVSTVSSAIQYANYLRDRVHIKVKVQKNMETVNDPIHDGMLLTMVTVTNAGRRPVTVTNVGLMYLYTVFIRATLALWEQKYLEKIAG